MLPIFPTYDFFYKIFTDMASVCSTKDFSSIERYLTFSLQSTHWRSSCKDVNLSHGHRYLGEFGWLLCLECSSYILYRLSNYTVVCFQCDDSEHSSEPLDISRLSESIARATCLALVPLLDLLSAASFSTLAVRTTIHPDNVSLAVLSLKGLNPVLKVVASFKRK